ncbi:MAG TPA: hypothetical protein PLX35_17585 [Cyclobacteriaceae bacterium]|nr:hypothetical protein [Cyclobacteriaceae bacterium]
MKTNNRMTEKAIDAGLIAMLFFVTGIYSCVAQNQPTSRDVLNQVKNAGEQIHLAPGLNLNAKAAALSPFINSPYLELKPAVAPHGTRLYFSRSNHPNNTGGINDPEDIWYVEFDKNADVWSEAVRLPGELNNAGPNFISGVSVTGDTIFLGNQYLHNGKMRDGMSYAVNVDGVWSAPKPIHIKNEYNTSEHENNFVSLKFGVIISAIQRGDTNGDRDLYVSFYNGGTGTEPINMGSIINTGLEESSPYLAADGKTLYFASKGHHGYGGYDIYRSNRLDDSWTNWSTPENMGPVVNGPMDDEFFLITHCKRFAFFSKQVSVHNVDLYRIPMYELFVTPAEERQKVTSCLLKL